MTFQGSYNPWQAVPFPHDFGIPMIAPLWADLTFVLSGSVYSKATDDPATLEQVVHIITDLNPGLSDYQPTLVVVVTWFEARLHMDSTANSVSI